MERIKFIKLLRFGVASALVSPLLFSSCSNPNVPSYLKGYEDLYADSPRKATLNYLETQNLVYSFIMALRELPNFNIKRTN